MRTRTLSDRNRRNGKPAWLRDDAARSYEHMKRLGMPKDCVSDAGRTYAEQAEMYRLYREGKLPATAARPGTSLHETGIALDVAEPARTWVRQRGREHGWVKDKVRNEPWHMEYDPKLDRYPWRKVKVTKRLDSATYRAICRATGRRVTTPSTVKGKRSFWKRVQRTVNSIMRGTKGWKPLVIDGSPGPLTIRGVQSSLRKVNRVHRPKVDGSLGPHTIACWQRALNAGKWGGTKRQING